MIDFERCYSTDNRRNDNCEYSITREENTVLIDMIPCMNFAIIYCMRGYQKVENENL